MRLFFGILISAFLASSLAFAEEVSALNDEANDAIYHLSLCAAELPTIVNNGAWIGKTTRWESATKDYGFNFHVFRQIGFTQSEKVGTLKLTAAYKQNPPLDASAYNTTCTIVFTKSQCASDEAVCGQPPMPPCPEDMACIQVMPAPKIYDNICAMEEAKATLQEMSVCLSHDDM